MDMEQLYNYLPRELVTFVLVTLFSLLIGLSQRRISLKREGETTLFRDRPYIYFLSESWGICSIYSTLPICVCLWEAVQCWDCCWD